jgi:L-serine dehydratase
MSKTLIPSIFNDVIGPVMRGPSSSHSAASVRLGLLIHDLCGGRPDRVALQYDSLGSLATTHESQGTDMGLYGGMMGFAPDDARLPDSPTLIADAGTQITIDKPELGDAHPNTYRIEAEREGTTHTMVALSTGGGMIEVIELDGFDVTLFGDYALTLLIVEPGTDATAIAAGLSDSEMDEIQVITREDGKSLVIVSAQKPIDDMIESTPGVSNVHRLRAVLPVRSRRNLQVPFHHASELTQPETISERPLSDWAITYEMQRGGITEDEVHEQARHILDIMRTGVETGLAGTEYSDRILGWQSGKFVEMQRTNRLLDGGLLNDMIAYVTALMEAKSAMEVIVAAPTAGACATFPGALLAAIDSVEASDRDGERALLTGGLIGVFVTNRSSFAAEVGGCQAETGAGAAMAAAALVELAGGNAYQSLSAASQSLQNVLGLICDPVGNRVEAPCLGRNVSGAANALSCANMALAGYDHVIPFDEVLDAHRQVSELMARELRCTGLGGLAITPTAQRIELSLKKPS